MPVKKSLPKAGSAFRPSKAPAMPSSLPTPPPLQVAVPVATRTENSIALGTLMICAVALLAVFGTSMMAGIVGITSATSYWTCQDSPESANNFILSSLVNSASFKTYNGDINKVKFFDVYTRGVASCVKGTSKVTSVDKCIKDVCVGSTCTPTAVASCTPQDKNCQLQESFILTSTDLGTATKYWMQTSATTRSNFNSWKYNCPNGCSNGACVKPPVCTDSDVDSNTGQSSNFIQGTTIGITYGSSTIGSKTDMCNGAILTEYSCAGNGQVGASQITCDNGCENGACIKGCAKIKLGTTEYSLSPCSMDKILIDQNGDVPFGPITITQKTNDGKAKTYNYSVYGYGVGFPAYGVIGDTSSGGATGNFILRNFHFNDDSLFADYPGARNYEGYLPIKITDSASGQTGELDLQLKAGVNPPQNPVCSSGGDSYCIDLVSPNGGAVREEAVIAGQPYQINWTQKNIDSVTIGYKICDSCLDWIAFAYKVSPTSTVHSYPWNIPISLKGKTVRIEITGYKTGTGSKRDISNNLVQVQ